MKYTKRHYDPGGMRQRAADKLPDFLDEIERLRRELDLKEDELRKTMRDREDLERQLTRSRAAQVCVSCNGTVCPPMQCGSCIEREEPAPGMPARPVTTAFREQLKSVLAAFTIYVNIPTEESWMGIHKAVLEASVLLGECPVPHPKG